MSRRRVFLILGALLLLSGCARIGIGAASVKPVGTEATPPALAAFGAQGPVETAADWRARMPVLQRAFEDTLYGAMPDDRPAEVVSKRVIDPAALGGAAQLEEWTLRLRHGSMTLPMKTALLTPVGGERHPVVVMASFCGNHAMFDDNRVSKPSGWYPGEFCDGTSRLEWLGKAIFGEHIRTPPLADIIARGYALATFYPGDIVPDKDELAPQVLASFAPEGASNQGQGALAAWAWGFSRVIDALDADSRYDDARTAVFGHSRHGKAALIAGAYDERVDLVIAHQSGTGGATLARAKVGESIEQITGSYPFWFNETYAEYAGMEDQLPVDQHMLIALVAPRPLLLGNARLDIWSGPNGAFRAAEGADPVYELLGAEGLDQPDLKRVNYDADIAFYMRGGLHGITGEDWTAFLAFLDAQFKGASAD